MDIEAVHRAGICAPTGDRASVWYGKTHCPENHDKEEKAE